METKFLETYLEKFSKALDKDYFSVEPKELYEPMQYILTMGGKRIRPIMLLLGCKAYNGDLQKALKPALGIEFFHNFSLMHDDIMDQAPLRRGKDTVHIKYNLNTAILSGDGLLLKSFETFNDLEPDLFKKCINIFTQTGITLCEGQQYDINFETQNIVSLEEYIKMITFKTGVLGAAAFQIGALIANANDIESKEIYEFGKLLGIAFQLKDDYLDVFGDSTKFGKMQAGDIIENKKTILYILAMENSNESQRKELLYWYNIHSSNIDKIYGVEKIFRTTQTDVKALDLIEKYTQDALIQLEKLSIDIKSKETLKLLINYLLKREE